MVPHTFNPSTREAEAGRALRVRVQSGLQSRFQDRLQRYREPLSQKKKNSLALYKRPMILAIWNTEAGRASKLKVILAWSKTLSQNKNIKKIAFRHGSVVESLPNMYETLASTLASKTKTKINY